MAKRPSEEEFETFSKVAAYISGEFQSGNTRPCDVKTAKAAYGITSSVAVEVLVVTDSFQQFILRHRNPKTDIGDYEVGLHIFGGFMQSHISTKEKVLEICEDDGGVGSNDIMEIIGVIARRDWYGQHEYGHPVSELIVVVVSEEVARNAVKKRDDLELLNVKDGIPEGMIDSKGIHEELLEEYFDWVKSPNRFSLPI